MSHIEDELQGLKWKDFQPPNPLEWPSYPLNHKRQNLCQVKNKFNSKRARDSNGKPLGAHYSKTGETRLRGTTAPVAEGTSQPEFYRVS